MNTKRVVLLTSSLLVAVNAYACVGDSSSNDAGTDANTFDSTTPDTGTKDSATSDAPADSPTEAGPACNTSKPFGTPVAIAALNVTTDQGEARLTSDSLNVYLYNNATGASALATASRSSPTSTFSAPATLYTTADAAIPFGSPTLTPDELTLYYGGINVYDTTRTSADAGFGPGQLTATMSDPAHTGAPFVQGDGTMLWFVSRTTTSDAGATVGAADIYRAPITGVGTTGPWQHVTELNTAAEEELPTVTPDGLVIYFERTVTTDAGVLNQIWTGSRTSISSAFTSIVEVTELSDGVHNSRPTWISPDNCTIYFDRDGAGDAGTGYNIYAATRGN